MRLSPTSSRATSSTPRKQATPSNITELPSPSDGSKDNLIKHTLPSPHDQGQENPVFSFDSVSLFSRAPSRASDIQQTSDASFRALPPIRRGSYFPFLPSASRNNLVVPPLTAIEQGQRRSSFTSSTLRESALISTSAAFSRPRPLVSLSIDDIPGHDQSGGLPMRSPGLLSISSMWSTSDLRRSLGALTKPEPDTVSHVGTASLSNFSGSFSERMHELVRAFSSRTQRAKEKISQPPTPSSESDYDAKSAVSGGEEPQPPKNIRMGAFLPMGSRASDAFSDENHDHFVGVWHCKFKTPKFFKKLTFPETMEPHNKIYVTWLFLVSLAFLYNAVVIPLRGVFPYQTSENLRYWLIIDYICDVIYILDIIAFKCRLRFTNNGIIESNPKEAKKHYMRKWMFKFDVMSLVPLDFFYFIKSVGANPWLRLPRVLKIQTYWEFYERCDQASKSSAHAIRIIKTVSYMLFLIHVETCGYYAVSVYEGLGTNDWVYSGEGVAYIRCFYLATKTATSIGNNPTPTNKLEYIFMTFYWLSGVFLFALLIGQIRDIVEAATLVKDNYRKKMDSCLWYMQSINLPQEMKDRVREWFLYNWEQQKTIDERSLVSSLPKKLQTDLAINVHFNTLSKVQLFQDCERNLLYDLVLKLRPILYLPRDFICKKGEVGREMYIVTQGQVEVVGGEDGETVLATLHEGSVFGEISLLAMSGRGNRRTADVRSKGYTNVFTLSKHDFEMAMTEYPDAQALLKRRAKKLLKANEKMEKKKKLEAEEIIKTPPETPKLLQTVIQIMDPDSNFVKQLNPSLRKSHHSLRTHSRSHSHRLSASASNIHHLTPPRSHSFRLSSQPTNCPALTPDPVGCPRTESFDTDDDNDDDVFDNSSDDVSLSEVLHNALADSSFDDSGNDDDDDNDGGDEELLIERYGTNFKQGKQPRSRQSPQRQAESSKGCEKEDRKSLIESEQDGGENGNVDAVKELLKNGSALGDVRREDRFQTGDSLNSESPDSRRRDIQGLDGKKEDGINFYIHLQCSPHRYNPKVSVRSSIKHQPDNLHQANQTQEEAVVNNDQSDYRNGGNFLQDIHSAEMLAENNTSGDITVIENMSKSKSAKLAPPNLNLGDTSECSEEGVGGRVRKLSVVSPPVSPVSPRDKQNTPWSPGRTQFVSLKESSSDLIMRCFTPVETPPSQTHLTAEYVKSRTSPETRSRSPIAPCHPVITNGLEEHRHVRSPYGDIPVEHHIRSPYGDIPVEHRSVRSPYGDITVENQVRSPYGDIPVEHRRVRSPYGDIPVEHHVRSTHGDIPVEHHIRSPHGDIPVEHRVRSPHGDIPAENRVTFSVEVHRQKSANSSTTDIHGHLETTL